MLRLTEKLQFGSVALAAAIALTSAHANAFPIDSLDGPPTANELASLKAAFNFAPFPAPVDATDKGPFNIFLGNHHNNYVYGETGGAIEGMVALYEITHDRDLLDAMIYFADQILAHRNDRWQTTAGFTGKAELCWPNQDFGAPDYGDCMTEQGDVLGHFTTIALEIAKSPAIWNETTPVPDTMHYGTTYLQRAQSYLTEARKTMDGYLTVNFVNPTTHRFIWPDTDAYGAISAKNAKARGTPVPWNQNAMLANGYLSTALSLQLLGQEPAVVQQYLTIEKVWVDALLATVIPSTEAGMPLYLWCYGPDQKQPCSEDTGHGGYDFWGIYRAYATPHLGFTLAQVVPFANTFADKIMLPAGGFAARVDGTGTGGNVGSTWLYVAYFRHDLFQPVATPLIADAKKGDPDTTGRILWLKWMNSRGWPAEPIGSDAGVPVSDAGTHADARAPADAATPVDASVPSDSGPGSTGGDAGPAGAGGSNGSGSGSGAGTAGTTGTGGATGGVGGAGPGSAGAAGSGGHATGGNGTPPSLEGCSCRASGSSSRAPAPVAAMLLAAAAYGRARRGRRARTKNR